MLVSIVVPAYKKEKTILDNVQQIYDALKGVSWEFEIIIVEDGELDDTKEILKKINRDNLQVVGYKNNQGKGFAVKYGMKKARGDYIAFIDAGNDINPENLVLLIEHIEWYKADIVVASKRHLASKVKYTALRRIYSWVYYLLVRLLFGLKIKDTQTGLKVYKKEVVDKVLPRILIKEFAFDIEMLAVARYLGFKKIYEAPVELNLSFNDSTFGRNLIFDPVIANMLRDTLAVFYRLNILRYYDDGNELAWKRHFDELTALSHASLPKIENVFFSIIIPTRRVNDFLRESIAHINKLKFPNYEVIVVLDEDTKDDILWNKKVRKIISGKIGPGEKRNLGVSKSVGNVLAFLDDDAYPDPNWLTNASEIFKRSDVYALGGPAMTPPNASFGEKVSGKLLESKLVSGNTYSRHIPGKRMLIDDYPTVNFFVRRDAFNFVGGFTTEFWPGEDTKICLDLIDYFGYKFLYDPTPKVYHHRRDGLTAHLKQISRYGKHRGQFTKIFPKNSRLPSFYIPSAFVLGLMFGPIISYFVKPLWYVYLSVIVFYIYLILSYAIRVFFDEKNLLLSLEVALGVFLTHFVYGINFIYGILKKPKLKLKEFDAKTGNYIGG